MSYGESLADAERTGTVILLKIASGFVVAWGLAFYFFAVRSSPEKRTGWHPDGRD